MGKFRAFLRRLREERQGRYESSTGACMVCGKHYGAFNDCACEEDD